MIEKIKELEKKGFRIAIFPLMVKKEWYWIAGVYVGNESKAEWVDQKIEGTPKAGYLDYEEALTAAIDYCENYNNKVKKHVKKAKL